MKSSCIIKMAIIIGILCMTCTSGAIVSAKVPVFVSIVPQKYFVKKIGGDLVDISIMVQPGARPGAMCQEYGIVDIIFRKRSP